MKFKRKMKRISKRKAILLSLLLAVFLLTPIFSNAQKGGLFGYGNYDESYDNSFGVTNRGLTNINDNGETGIVNQTFGEVPISSGIIIMLVASAGYVLLKKKED
ncbi:MAG: hypothetical protein II670_12440 [Alphaproteobacteria bacterium]|nr:hypothetical protein [Alphaproteobacteria bacterium]